MVMGFVGTFEHGLLETEVPGLCYPQFVFWKWGNEGMITSSPNGEGKYTYVVGSRQPHYLVAPLEF